MSPIQFNCLHIRQANTLHVRVSLTVGLIGRMTVNGAYFICLQYSSEIFPTVIRGQGVGVFLLQKKNHFYSPLNSRLHFVRLWEELRSSSPRWLSTLPSSPQSSPSLSLASALSLALSQPSSSPRQLVESCLILSGAENPDIGHVMLNYQRRGGVWKGSE